MEMTVPIENQEIPQTGLEETTTKTGKSRTPSVTRVTGLVLEYNPTRNEVQGFWDEPEDNDCYFNFQFYTSAINPDHTMLKEGITNKTQAFIKGLSRGQRVFLRVRLIRNTWLGCWSEPLEKWVP